MRDGKKKAQKTKQALFSSFQITKGPAKQLQHIRQKKFKKSDKASFINLEGKLLGQNLVAFLESVSDKALTNISGSFGSEESKGLTIPLCNYKQSFAYLQEPGVFFNCNAIRIWSQLISLIHQ